MPKIGEKTVSVTVAVRIRPLSTSHESSVVQAFEEEVLRSNVTMRTHENLSNTLIITDPDNPQRNHTFTFDHLYNSMTRASTFEGGADQETIFRELSAPLLEHSLEGYNTCLFAYGQTGSGKTYTITGFENPEVPVARESERHGILPRLANALFEAIRTHSSETRTLQVRMSYYEIYNEKVRCLLNPDPNVTYRVREHPILGPFVVDLTSVELQDENDMLRSIRRATRYRHTAATQMNATSSRSHAVCSLNITSTVFDANSGEVSETVSVANLVDLAGSERTDAAGTSGIRLIEGTNINKSLLTLGHVIEALAASSSDTPLSPRGGGSSGAPRKFVPYRESLLTWLLKESLGGNSRTVMLATVSPHARNYDESLNTLRYADRAKYIRSVVVINVDTGKQLITDLKAEISILREQLERYTSHWAMANRWGAANGPNSIMLPHAQMPYLIQTYPLPSLNEIFLYYLNKDDVVITRSQSALVTGSADAQSSKISVESLIGHQDYQKVSLRSGLNVLLDHVVLKFERSEHHRGQMYVTHLRGPVRINNTIVHPSHTPRYIPPQANLEVGMYQFKVYNPQETDPYMGEEEEVKQSIPKTISRDQPSSSSALNKRTTRGHPTMDKPNSVSHANSVSNDAVVIQKALEKYLSPSIDVSSLECRKVLCNRRGVEGECVLAKDGGSVRLFTWNEETEQWKPTENVPPQRTRELAASLVEVQDASRAVQSILGAAKFSEILKKLPRENELALEGPAPESDTVRLVRAEQFRDKIIAMRWNAGEKIWVRATVADAERCTMRLMEKERAKEFDQTVKALLAKRGAETLQASYSTKPGASSASNQVPAVSRETQEVQEEEEEESELDQAKIEELNAAFAERAKALDSEREKIEAQISVVKSQLDTITAENQECERQHREKKEQILKQQVIQRAELEAEAASLHNANQQLRSTVEEKAAYINVLLNQMKQVEETRDVSIHSIQGLRKNIACLEKEKEKAQIEIQSIQENILQLRAENERMKADRTNVQHQLSVEVPETEEEIQAKIILLGAECQERTEQHEQTYRNLVTLQKQCETIYDRIKANEETLSKVHSEKEYLNELIQSEEAELNAIINETHQSLQQKKEGLEKNLVEARRMQLQHSDEISIMVEQARKDERRMLLAQMTSLEQENAKLLGEARQGFHMSIRSLQRERNREKEVVQGIMAKRESMKKRLKDLETTLDNKERQVKALVDEHVGWLSKLQVCKSNVEKGQNVTEKITNVEVKLRQTLQRAQDLERLAKDNKKEEDELRSEARALKDQHGHLRQDLDALVNKMRTLEKEIKTARMDALDMKREASFLVRGEETRDIRHLSSRNLTELIASSPRNVATPSYMRQTVASQARQPTDSGADASDVMMATSGSFSQPPTVNTMQQPGLRKIFSSSTLRPGSPVSSPHGMKSPTSGHSTTPRRRGNGTHSPRR